MPLRPGVRNLLVLLGWVYLAWAAFAALMGCVGWVEGWWNH